MHGRAPSMGAVVLMWNALEAVGVDEKHLNDG